MSIDLNIDHYTNKELEILFTLPETYDASHVERSETNMYVQLMNQVDPSMKPSITLFLKYAKERLISSISLLRIIIDSTHKPISSKVNDFIYSFPEPKMINQFTISFMDIPIYYPIVQCSFQYNKEMIYVPDGIYKPEEMMTLLSELGYFKVSIKTHTLFYSTESFTLEFQKSGRIFGFQQQKYTSELNIVTELYEIKSEFPYGKETECLWVDIYDYHDTFNTNIIYSNKSPTTMACIPVKYGDHIRQKGEIIRTYTSAVKVERLRIRLYNKYGEPFLLKSDFSLILEIK